VHQLAKMALYAWQRLAGAGSISRNGMAAGGWHRGYVSIMLKITAAQYVGANGLSNAIVSMKAYAKASWRLK
jgi:hypothetical protein